MTSIGFVGLGHMGLPMATHLVQAGFMVSGYDLNPQQLAAFTAAGGQTAPSLVAMRNHSIIITMLQTPEQICSVYLGEQGLFAQAIQPSLFIDCSSIDVASSKTLAEKAHLQNHAYLDAPVSGGMAGAKAASLTFLVGGDSADLEKAQPILAKMGKTIIHTGGNGSGQAAKICNNMILGVSMIAVAEAFVLAEKLGLSAHSLFEVVSNSSGQCWVMSKYCPMPDVLPNVPANSGYVPGFAAAMMLKDLKLSQDEAKKTQVITPLGAAATALYQQFNDQGQGQLDFSAIIKAIAQQEISL